MTDSYNLSLRPKILVFHGLNNNPQGFYPLMKELKSMDYDVEFITLPCHGEKRKEANDYKSALRVFDQTMKRFENVPYYAVAFSHGALYLNLWMEKNPLHKPLKQVLLAPAFYIKKQKIVGKILGLLPGFFFIKSLAPKKFRRYPLLSLREYNILFQSMLTYQKLSPPFRTSTLVLIDPKDELVDAEMIKSKMANVELVERSDLKKGLGQHHLIFHPDYYSKDEWDIFLSKMRTFLDK